MTELSVAQTPNPRRAKVIQNNCFPYNLKMQ